MINSHNIVRKGEHAFPRHVVPKSVMDQLVEAMTEPLDEPEDEQDS